VQESIGCKNSVVMGTLEVAVMEKARYFQDDWMDGLSPAMTINGPGHVA
jgi:hypothetical protein